jgi:hypothetical protein
MNQTEKDMCFAMRQRHTYYTYNTAVKVHEAHMSVHLHGNLIAEVYDNGVVRATLAGWNTPTSRSRINAVMQCFGGSGISVVKGVPKYEGKPLGLHEWAVYYGKEKEV